MLPALGTEPIMPARRRLTEAQRQELRAALESAPTPDDLRRLLAVWLPEALGLSVAEVAVALGCRRGAVQRARESYRAGGARRLHNEGRRTSTVAIGGLKPLEARLASAGSLEEFRRILCVLLPARFGLTDRQTAALVGWAAVTVGRVQAEYRRMGEAALLGARKRTLAARQSPLASKLRAAMQNARTLAEFRGALCVYLRAVLGLSLELVAETLGWWQPAVSHLHHRYLREGDDALRRPGRGGWRLLTRQKEAAVLRGIASDFGSGLVEFDYIHQTVEQAAGRPVPPAIVQSILDRHGWSCAALVVTPRFAGKFGS
jgi:Homeodomain-like domain